MIASRTSRTPRPSFALTSRAFGNVQAEHLVNLVLDPFDIGARKIDLVNDGNDVEIVGDRQIGVRNRLGFHTLEWHRPARAHPRRLPGFGKPHT